MPSVQHLSVTPAEAGMKLLGFLERRLEKQVPRAAVMRWIRTGQVRVDKGRAKPFVRLAAGQVVRVPPFEPGESTQTPGPPVPADLDIVHQDQEILLVNKPHGLPVQPGTKQADAVATRLKAMFAKTPFPPTPAHRLDRDTTGLLVVARTFEALSRLHRLWREGNVAKTYLCWVEGTPGWDGWTTLTDRLDQPGKRGRVLADQPQGKPAACAVTILGQNQDRSLLAVRLDKTGRKHQIRVQLASRGLPILGDRKYKGPPSTQGMLLHACHVGWEGRCFFLAPSWTGFCALPEKLLTELPAGLGLPRECTALTTGSAPA